MEQGIEEKVAKVEGVLEQVGQVLNHVEKELDDMEENMRSNFSGSSEFHCWNHVK